MKRLISTLLLIASFCIAASAQSSFEIDQLFDGRYRTNPAVTENVMKGGSLKKYDISLYHSLNFTGIPAEAKKIERLVARDGTKATDKEVSYRNGALYYGFYEFPMSHGKNRYIFYLNQHANGSGNKIILIYIEGSAPRNQIKKLLK